MDDFALDLLRQRASVPSRHLAEPAPDAAQLRAMLEVAVHVPDHGRLAPWRFIELREEGRRRLGQVLQDTFRREHPDAGEAALEKEASRLAHAPLVVVVVARLTPEHKVPVIEQQLSAGCVCLQLLHAAHAMGFAAQWLTGWAAYHPAIHAALGLGGHERITGFVHIGTPTAEPVRRPRPDVGELLQTWPA
jgi:nitroreductase